MANTSSKPTSASPTGDEPIDKIQRGNYKFSVAGAGTWIGLRALDPFIQCQLLFRGHGDGLVSRIGIATASSVMSTTPVQMMEKFLYSSGGGVRYFALLSAPRQ
jgi:hypothetical protein